MKNTSILDPANPLSFNQNFREKRFEFFRNLFENLHSEKPIEILDIGGTEIYWERMNFTESKKYNITLLNLEKSEVKYSNFKSLEGDACNLSMFDDNQFDIVFSNSVIEHLFCFENQKKMADEIRRVGKNYFIQTPNYYFPIEPHWLCPFYQFMPFKIRVFLTRNFNMGHYQRSKTYEDAEKRVREVKLLCEREMKKLFPEGKVKREYFMGLKKSITMYYFPELQKA